MASESDRRQTEVFEPNLTAANDETGWSTQFSRIIETEFAAINSRRAALEADRIKGLDAGPREGSSPDSGKPFVPVIPAKRDVNDVVGLALSGGGIRSSAICLGVLQALNHYELIKRIDYLSTVSGGGYIGSSLSATMTAANRFVFGEQPLPGSTDRASEISDTQAVGHIRNYSNYLIPAGARDLLTGIAIVVRGLVANVGFALPVVLLLVALTIFSNPARSCLYAPNLFGVNVLDGQVFSFIGNYPVIKTFGFSLAGAFLAVVFLIVGVIHRMIWPVNRRELFTYLVGISLVMGLICNAAHYFPIAHFALTLSATLLGLLLFLLWALRRSFLPDDRLQEFRGHLPTMGATYLVLVGAIAFFEFQPFMIAQMFGVAEGSGTDQAAGLVAGVVVGWIKSLAAVATPIAALVTVFRQQLGGLLKGAGASDLTSRILAYVAKAAVWIAGLALPLLIWIGYLYLCFWGIANDKAVGANSRQCDVSGWSADPMTAPVEAAPASLSGKVQFNSEAKTLSAEIASKDGAIVAAPAKVDVASHIPHWLLAAAKPFGDPNPDHWSMTLLGYYRISNNINLPMGVLYFTVALVLLIVSLIMRPNANSLHRLYRDRLSKAFLFRPDMPKRRMAKDVPSLDQGRDFPELDLKLSDLCPRETAQDGTRTYQLAAPYHLINAALNIQGSDYANRRGRNADFFLFSPVWSGSEATGYCDTAKLEQKESGLDLATAMAISGAAASSNMGSNSIRPLTPTLALLNVRLGYWLKNPQYVDDQERPQHRSTLYLWSEISGRLYENADAVYLTDGGHIENLGVYELLRRRCKVIIAVDAEADAPMNFGSLMTLQRYARIDLGVRINLPWQPIRDRTRALMARNADRKTELTAQDKADDASQDHVHVAIGVIDYGAEQNGYLIYIKSSLTGDENDYICDFARRNDTFPHEATGDQFFSEEQFEVYRALGFHMTHGFLNGELPVSVGSGTGRRTTNFTKGGDPVVDAVREALGLPALPRQAATATGTMIDQG
ncbi:patatin-like phospholipase family protein [Bradyrhizobium sp. 44]|uniref:patatin-like phospholipase family protein n=1 Tax=Bradyrhizobium sp. 44 TaxID=2782675 RepID=UPI001FFA06C3